MNRQEHDSFGAIEVPSERLWGAQTQRSLEHFHISTERMPVELMMALAIVKRACASVNRDAGLLAPDKAAAIVTADFVKPFGKTETYQSAQRHGGI